MERGRRTPGRAKGPERVGDILERVLKESGILDRQQEEDLVQAWKDVAGEDVAEYATIHSFRGGVVTVGVMAAPLLMELERYRKEELLKGLRERLRGVFVAELRFRLV